MRIVVLTSVQRHHIYFANKLLERFNVVGVFQEPHRSSMSGQRRSSSKIRKAWGLLARANYNPIEAVNQYLLGQFAKAYRLRAASVAAEYFLPEGERVRAPEGCMHVITRPKSINDPQYVEMIRRLNPELIAVLGTSLLKEPIISIPPKGVLNIHSGLSPYYRGSDCVFWPLYNEEPQYVGVTVHYIDLGTDSGDIIHQARPCIEAGDDEATLFCKVIKLGVDLMIQAIEEAEAGTIKAYPQWAEGNLYLAKMRDMGKSLELQRKLDNGLLRRYLERSEHEREVRIVP